MAEQNSALTETEYADAFEALWAKAQTYFKNFVKILQSYGIEPDPDLAVHPAPGMNNYYFLIDRQIYLALPGLRGGVGEMYLQFLKKMFETDSNEVILELFELLLPRIVAHEMGHALRHRYNLFDRKNLWHEEQAANQLAMALVKRRMSPERKRAVRLALAEAISKLGKKIEAKDIALDSYRNIVQALNVSEQIDDSTAVSIELLRNVFSIDTDDLLRASGQLPEQVVDRIELREAVIDDLNTQYTKDAARYAYSHFGWMYFDFLSKQSDYVDEFAVTRLDLKHRLLPEIDASQVLDRIEIRALYQASRALATQSELGRRYFYKRYRIGLLRRLEVTTLNVPNGRVESDLTQLMEMWEEGSSDPLDYLGLVCPDDLKGLFPNALAHSDDARAVLPDSFLPTLTDRRLWRYFAVGESDVETANTVERLEILDQIPMLRPLPANLQLWLIHRMYRLKLDSGEPALWMGEKNTDIFILREGLLEIIIQGEGKADSKHIGLIRPGNLFGEFSFISNEAGSATVRAVRPSECYVFKGADLRPMTFNHPAVLLQMAKSLAEKLSGMNELAAAQTTNQTVRMARPPLKNNP